MDQTQLLKGVLDLAVLAVVQGEDGYGHGRDGVLMARSREVPGVSVNDLTDPELLDVSGNAALNGVPVEVAPA